MGFVINITSSLVHLGWLGHELYSPGGNSSFVVIIHAMGHFSNEKYQGITLDTLNLRLCHQGHSQGQGCLTILINMHKPLI